MIFVRPVTFEILLANERKDDFHDEVLVYTINENYQLIEQASIELFFHSRNRVIINGLNEDGEWVSKNLLSLRTKDQYGNGKPIYTIHDLKLYLEKMISNELAKKDAYLSDPKKYSFWKSYA